MAGRSRLEMQLDRVNSYAEIRRALYEAFVMIQKDASSSTERIDALILELEGLYAELPKARTRKEKPE